MRELLDQLVVAAQAGLGDAIIHPKMIEILHQYETLEMDMRRTLWLGHGHYGLYGDDGEMQCAQCAPVWDYKRTPLNQCREAAFRARMAQMSAGAPTWFEVCICAALKLDDGRIIRGHRHDDCYHTFSKWRLGGQDLPTPGIEAQGFVTSRGRFVGRAEAYELQVAAGLFKDRPGVRILVSEDLY